MLAPHSLYFNRIVTDIRSNGGPIGPGGKTEIVKTWLVLLLAAFVVSGCKTTTIESRKKERYTAYAQLSPELRAAVDQGQIKVGMPMDAVYIAWGPPSQVLEGESPGGATTTWLYHGTGLQEYRYWAQRPMRYRHGIFYDTYLEHDYYPVSYTRAEVIFENGAVKQWRTLQRPYP